MLLVNRINFYAIVVEFAQLHAIQFCCFFEMLDKSVFNISEHFVRILFGPRK